MVKRNQHDHSEARAVVTRGCTITVVDIGENLKFRFDLKVATKCCAATISIPICSILFINLFRYDEAREMYTKALAVADKGPQVAFMITAIAEFEKLKMISTILVRRDQNSF